MNLRKIITKYVGKFASLLDLTGDPSVGVGNMYATNARALTNARVYSAFVDSAPADPSLIHFLKDSSGEWKRNSEKSLVGTEYGE